MNWKEVPAADSIIRPPLAHTESPHKQKVQWLEQEMSKGHKKAILKYEVIQPVIRKIQTK